MRHWWKSATTTLRRTCASEQSFLLIIILFAFALRVFRLGAQAIWWDESLSVYRATHDLGTLLANIIYIQNIVTVDTLPQLYFLLLYFIVPFVGVSEFALRFLSVFANIASVPLIYALGRRWFDRRVGIVAAFLSALSPFYVWYAQEARPYALVLFWSTLAIYALTRTVSLTLHANLGAAKRWGLVYIGAAVASLFTHYYSLFLFPFHVILIAVFVWRNPKSRPLILLPAIPFPSVLLLIPQVRASAVGNAETGPFFVSFDVMLRDLLNSFSVGITVDLAQVWWIDLVILVILLLGIAIPNSQLAIRSKITNRNLRFVLLAYLLLPIVGVYIISLYRPLYQNSRYLIAISPAFYLGVAAGFVALARRWPFRVLALLAFAAVIFGAAISLNNLYFDPSFGKDDHRAWADYMRERARPGDFLILNSPHTEQLYRYYAGNLMPITTLPILRADNVESPVQDATAIRDALLKKSRVWYLAMHVPFDDPQNRIETLLNQQGVLLDQTHFAGTSTAITLSLFVPTFPFAETQSIRYPLNLAFNGHLHLKGYDAPAVIISGQRSPLSLYWLIDEPVGEDYAVSLRLVDQANTIAAQRDGIPLGNRAGSSTWPAQKIIQDTQAVPLNSGILPGMYRLQVVPYHSATGAALGDVVTLGDIRVTH